MTVHLRDVQASQQQAIVPSTPAPGALQLALLDKVTPEQDSTARRGLERRRDERRTPNDRDRRPPRGDGPKVPPRPPRVPPRIPEPGWPSPFPGDHRCTWSEIGEPGSYRDRYGDWWCRW